MNKSILAVLLMILFGCSVSNRSTFSVSEDEKIANEIIHKTAVELMATTGLQPCGSGGQMMDRVKMLALSFDYTKPIQIEEARELLMTAVDVFLSKINSDDRIHPYLYTYPFGPKNVEIRIFLKTSDYRTVSPGQLSAISSLDGVFSYEIDNYKTNLFTEVLNETYEEAKRKSKKSLIRPSSPV